MLSSNHTFCLTSKNHWRNFVEKAIFLLIVLALLSAISGCSSKDEQVLKLKEQIRVLEIENSQLVAEKAQLMMYGCFLIVGFIVIGIGLHIIMSACQRQAMEKYFSQRLKHELLEASEDYQAFLEYHESKKHHS